MSNQLNKNQDQKVCKTFQDLKIAIENARYNDIIIMSKELKENLKTEPEEKRKEMLEIINMINLDLQVEGMKWDSQRMEFINI